MEVWYSAILTGIGLVTGFIMGSADAYLIKRKFEPKWILHAQEGLFLCIAVAAWLFTDYINNPAEILCAGVAYSLVNDIIINIRLGKPITYIGGTAKTDKLVRKVFKNGARYAAWKFIAILVLMSLAEYYTDIIWYFTR